MTPAVAYLRLSKDEDGALGPDAQRASILAYAKSKGLEVTSWHQDIGVSGTTPVPDRPGLMGALSALKAEGKGTVLVVAKRDRLARSVLVAATAEGLVRRLGCSVVSADGAGAGDGPEAQLMRTILDAFSEFERALIVARTRAALAVRRAAGLRVTRHPRFGFQHVDGRLVPDPREQVTLAAIHALRDAGMGPVAIARRLAAEGHVGRTGRPLARVTVSRALLASPAKAPQAV